MFLKILLSKEHIYNQWFDKKASCIPFYMLEGLLSVSHTLIITTLKQITFYKLAHFPNILYPKPSLYLVLYDLADAYGK